MKYYNRINLQIQEKIRTLISNFESNLTKPQNKFFTDMVAGVLISKSVLFSEVSRAICGKNEKIKHVSKRLFRNMKNINNKDELQDKYQEIIDKNFDEHTIFCVDNSDITKNNNHTKFEHIDRVRDGSSGQYKSGYYVTQITALDSKNKNPIPVYSNIFSLKAKALNSVNIETEKALIQSFKHHKNKGLYVFDRGYDDIKLINFMEEYNTKFLIRIKTNRNFIYKGKILNVKDIASKYKGRFNLSNYNKDIAKVSYIPVKLPKIENKSFILAVVYKKGCDPMFLLTNIKDDNPKISLALAKAYILRWKIEEFFRFMKQSFDLENIRVRKIKDMNFIMFTLQLATYIIAEISHGKHESTKVALIEISQPIFDKKLVNFNYYGISNGLSKLFNFRKSFNSLRLPKIKKDDFQLSFTFKYIRSTA